MTPECAEELGKRLTACKGFRPLAGLLDLQGRTWTGDLLWRWAPGVDVPDLRSGATRGCVVELLRQAQGEPHGHMALLCVEPPRWAWVTGRGVARQLQLADTEAEALVRAWEGAQ
jgi:hypothetical protein